MEHHQLQFSVELQLMMAVLTFLGLDLLPSITGELIVAALIFHLVQVRVGEDPRTKTRTTITSHSSS